MSEHPSTHPQAQPDQPHQPDQPEEDDAALWERRALRWDMADAGRAAWTPEATHCADPADCPTYRAALAALRLDPDTSPGPGPGTGTGTGTGTGPGHITGLTADDLTRAWRSGYADAADTHATAERWGRVLAVLEHRPAPDDLDW